VSVQCRRKYANRDTVRKGLLVPKRCYKLQERPTDLRHALGWWSV